MQLDPECNLVGDEQLIIDIVKYLHMVLGSYKWPTSVPGQLYTLSQKANELLERITGKTHDGQELLKLFTKWEDVQFRFMLEKFPEAKPAFDHLRTYFELREKLEP
jgi:hypothetical protein